jgi:valyl-tRNA synthetase
MMGVYPTVGAMDRQLIEQMTEIRSVVTQVRELKSKHQVKSSVAVPLYLMKNEQGNLMQLSGAVEILKKLAVLSEIAETSIEVQGAQSFLGMRDKYYVDLPVTVNVETERAEVIKEIEYHEGFVSGVRKKLENERFVQSAPADLVDKERKKLEDGLTRIKALQDRLNSLAG